MATEIPGNGSPDPLPRRIPKTPQGPGGGSLGPQELRGVPPLGATPPPERRGLFANASGPPGEPGAEPPDKEPSGSPEQGGVPDYRPESSGTENTEFPFRGGMLPDLTPPGLESGDESEVIEFLTPDRVQKRTKAVSSLIHKLRTAVPMAPEAIDAHPILHDLLTVEAGMDPAVEVEVPTHFRQEDPEEIDYDLGLKVATLKTVKAAVMSHLARQRRYKLPAIDAEGLLAFLDRQEILTKTEMLLMATDEHVSHYPLVRDAATIAAATERTRAQLEATGYASLTGEDFETQAEDVMAKVFSFTGRILPTERNLSVVDSLRGVPRQQEEYVSVLYKGNGEGLEVYGRETEEGTEYVLFGGEQLHMVRAGNIDKLTIRDTDVETIHLTHEHHSKLVQIEDSHIGLLNQMEGKVVVDNGLIANTHVTGDTELVTTGTDIVYALVNSGGRIIMDESYTGIVNVHTGGIYQTEGDVLLADVHGSVSRAYIRGDCTKFVGNFKAHGILTGKIGQYDLAEGAFITQANVQNGVVRQITETDHTGSKILVTGREEDPNYVISILYANLLGATGEKELDRVIFRDTTNYINTLLELPMTLREQAEFEANYAKSLMVQIIAARKRASGF